MRFNDEKFCRSWEKKSAKGQLHYIVVYGILWGVLVATFSQLFKVWDDVWDTAALQEAFWSADFLIRLLVFTAIGLGIHTYHWRSNNQRYTDIKRQLERQHQ
jgi:hypothetical protein